MAGQIPRRVRALADTRPRAPDRYNRAMEILVANPRGFCAGVDRAVQMVERALEILGAPIYVRHAVVHNRFVVERLRDLGAIFVEELAEVPDGATLMFSAHGVAQAVRAEAAARDLTVFDATCPLVTKVHLEVARHGKAGRDLVLIGHAGHVEIAGTLGQWHSAWRGRTHLVQTIEEVARLAPRDPAQLAYATQTTLSLDDTRAIIAALQQRFPAIVGPRHDDICYATQNRQDAVRRLVAECDLVLVIGSPASSNSNRLRELAERAGRPSYLIERGAELRPEWLAGCQRIGLTAGASAPEALVREVIDHLLRAGAQAVRELDAEAENMHFALPRELRATVG